MNKPRFFLLPMILLFVVLNGFFISGHNILAKWGIDNYVLIVANTLLLVLNLIVFLMQKKALENANPNVFVRSVMGGMMIKMFVFVIAIAVYKFTAAATFSKATVFAATFLYLLYVVVEVKIVSKLTKQKNA